jgi:hypothetical protein
MITIAPIADAVDYHDRKTPVGSRLRTKEWETVPTALRNAAQFSAGIESARVLQRIQNGISDMLSQRRNDRGALTDRSGMIRDITQLAIREGLTPADPRDRGTLKDPTSEIRAELIVQQQVNQAYGHANWLGGQDPDALDAAPAQELYRLRQAKVPRDWLTRWRDSGGRIWDNEDPTRMIALKTDPVWVAISRFGNPWPPYDFGSGMWVLDVLRPEAVRLGLIVPTQRVQPNIPEFDANLREQVRSLEPGLIAELKAAFGRQIQFAGDFVRWTGSLLGGRGSAFV